MEATVMTKMYSKQLIVAFYFKTFHFIKKLISLCHKATLSPSPIIMHKYFRDICERSLSENKSYIAATIARKGIQTIAPKKNCPLRLGLG